MKGEFIGLPIEIIDHADPSVKGVTGTIIDETKNILIINSLKGMKRVTKDHAIFCIGGVTVNGADIAYRPEDRIRKIK
jgi:RNase P/RNase MRP subunit p29